jgi:hypothetical protein
MSPILWHEPRAYLRAVYYDNERVRPLDSARLAAAVFAFMLGMRFVVGLRQEPDARLLGWPAMVWLAAGVALFVAYGLLAIISMVAPSIVIFSDKGVNNNRFLGVGWRIRFWAWDRIGMIGVGTEALADQLFRVVVLLDHDGGFLARLALADNVTPGDLDRFAAEHGVEVAGKERP